MTRRLARARSVALLLAVLLAAGLPAATPAFADEEVLLVGNSFLGGVRPNLRKLVRSAGADIGLRASSRRGATLEYHASATRTLRRLQAGGWTQVVLQEQSDGFPEENWPQARALDAEAAAVGAATVFLMTWRDRDDPLEDWDSLRGEPGGNEGYVPIAFELDAAVAPAGWVFREILIEEGQPDLWKRDGHHASKRGRYVVALTLYATIYRQSPVGLWAPRSLPPDQVLHDQQVVEAVVLDQAADWNIDAP